MDKTDVKILELLRENGRRPNVDMARILGVSEGTIRKRVANLLASGTLAVRGLVDPRAIGYDRRAVIELDVALPEVDTAAQALVNMPEVRSVYIVTGEYDIVIEAVFADEAHLMSFLSDRVARLDGVRSSKTSHVLRVLKQPGDWQVPTSADAA